MKVLYVPHWLKVALRGSNASKNVLLNVPELLSIVSQEDVGFYIYLNLYGQDLVPEVVRDTFTGHGVSLLEQAMDYTQKNPDSTLMSSWDNYQLNREAWPINLKDHVLTCDLGNEDTILLSHVPVTDAILKEVSPDPTLWFYRRLLRQWQPFVPFEVMVDTPLYLAYLRALSRAPGEEAENLKNAPQVEEKSEKQSTAA